jgi:hypothetical protein
LDLRQIVRMREPSKAEIRGQKIRWLIKGIESGKSDYALLYSGYVTKAELDAAKKRIEAKAEAEKQKLLFPRLPFEG